MTARDASAGSLVIRRAVTADASALAALAGELGYPSSPADVILRLAGLPDGDEIHVAVEDGSVVGWIHLAERRSLAVDTFAEIDGLVVAGRCRGAGVGSALLALVDPYARRSGLRRVVVRSNMVREAAHGFYQAAGFREIKRSAVFERDVE